MMRPPFLRQNTEPGQQQLPPLIRTPSAAIQEIGTAFAPELRAVARSISLNPEFAAPKGLARSALGGMFLGWLFMLGVALALWVPTLRQFGIYLFFLALFHFLEFFMTAVFHPRTLTFASFLLNHSPAYNIALLVGMTEYFIEVLFFPGLKGRTLLTFLGFVITLGGQVVRTLAMYTAGTNFTHIIAETRVDKHELVTSGVYALSRHPAYAGWWWYCVGTQLLLGNPVCVFAYAYVSYRFFHGRIHYEEARLFEFFGDRYAEYHQRVGTAIPFLRTPNLHNISAPIQPQQPQQRQQQQQQQQRSAEETEAEADREPLIKAEPKKTS